MEITYNLLINKPSYEYDLLLTPTKKDEVFNKIERTIKDQTS